MKLQNRAFYLVISLVVICAIFCVRPNEAKETAKKDASTSFDATATQGLVYLYINDSFTNETYEEYICATPMSEMFFNTYSATKWFSLPDCVYSWNLTSLYLTNMVPPDFSRLSSQLTTLQVLYPVHAIENWNWTILSRLPNLEYLSMYDAGITGTLPSCFPPPMMSVSLGKNNLSGTMDPLFFDCSSTLSSLDVAFNNLEGTIPYVGLENVQNLVLGTNRWTHWPDLVISKKRDSKNRASITAMKTRDSKTGEIQETRKMKYGEIEEEEMGFGVEENREISGELKKDFVPTKIRRNNRNKRNEGTLEAKRASMGPPSQLREIYLSNTPIQKLPDSESFASMTSLFNLFIQNNPRITGLPPIQNAAQLKRLYGYYIYNCSYSGSLPELEPRSDFSANDPGTWRDWNFSLNRLSGRIPESWYNYTWRSLDLSYNPISGTFPERLFGGARKEYISTWTLGSGAALRSLVFSNTSLNGTFHFDLLGAYNLSYLGLSNGITINMKNLDMVDFCNPNLTEFVPWNASLAIKCDLSGTNAHLCKERYPACFRPPCPPAPGLDQSLFTCVHGVWTSKANINSNTIVIPPNIPIVVLGNLTSNVITMTGLNSNIQIKEGCADKLKEVNIELTPQDIEKLTKTGKETATLLTVMPGASKACANNLNLVTISASSKAGGCKRVKVSNVSGKNSLSLRALFTIDKSRCNLWWIVLVSVIGGLILLSVITFVLLAVFVPAVREKVFPNSLRKLK